MREFVTQLLKGRIFENKNLETIAFDYILLSNRYNLGWRTGLSGVDILHVGYREEKDKSFIEIHLAVNHLDKYQNVNLTICICKASFYFLIFISFFDFRMYLISVTPMLALQKLFHF